MSYCTLEEAWGSDFKKKKKSRKEKKLESQEQKMLKESIDPQILIPETHRMADYRKDVTEDNLPKPDTSSIMGYDDTFDSYISPYQRYKTDPIQQSNESVLENNKQETFINELERPVQEAGAELGKIEQDIVTLTRKEYEDLKKEVVEGFANTTDEQFNQLILYIFTGLFYLLMLDMMYQLGKKSY